MNDRRRAILGRFQAGAPERLRRLGDALVELQEGRDAAEQARFVARELHTLKGESNMLGLARVGEALHAMEAALAGAPATCAGMRRGLRLVELAVQERLPDAEGALRDLMTELEGGPPIEAETSLAPRAPARPEGASPDASRGAPAAALWVKVESVTVDSLCEGIDELAVELGAVSTKLGAARGDLGAAALRVVTDELDRCRSRLGAVSELAWALRVEPVEPALEELVRHAHDLAARQGKRLRVVVRAARAAVERSVLDALRDPLLHLVRNAIDHGVELPADRGRKPAEATLTLSAEPVGAHVVIAVSDDGRGVDPARIRAAARDRGLLGDAEAQAATADDLFGLLFVHGFSTRATVTDVSGRGVGLDVVRDRVEALGGTVSLTSEAGRGSRFALTIPATVGRERYLVIEHDGLAYGVPSRSVVEIVDLRDHLAETRGARTTLRLRDASIPLRSLARTLGAGAGQAEPLGVVVDLGGHLSAFSVAKILGERELLRRSLDPLLQGLGYLAASSVLDDGRPVLMLLLPGLLRRPEFLSAPAVAGQQQNGACRGSA